jgi:ribosome maturation factor RimP
MARTGRGATTGARRPAPARSDVVDRAAARARFRAVIEPALPDGVDLEDVSVSAMGRRHLVRVTVDADGGIGHDELTDISHAVSAALDETEQSGRPLTPGAYTLEVSSPGVDRPLTLPRHWRRNVGRLVRVSVGETGVTGRITGTDDDGVTLDVDGRPVFAAFDRLGPGRVQVEFHRPGTPDDLDEDLDDVADSDDDSDSDTDEETDDDSDTDEFDGAGQPTEQEDRA